MMTLHRPIIRFFNEVADIVLPISSSSFHDVFWADFNEGVGIRVGELVLAEHRVALAPEEVGRGVALGVGLNGARQVGDGTGRVAAS